MTARSLAMLGGCALVLASPVVVAAAKPADAAREVLASPTLRFCRDGSFPLTSEELAWCDLLPPDGGACPGLRASCKLGARAELVGRRSVPRLELPSLGALGIVLLWTLFAAAVAALATLVVRNVVRRGWRKRRSPQPATPAAAPGVAAVPLPAPAEHDVDRLLESARHASDRRDWAQALADLHAALVRRLEADGVVHVHASRTNGEYLREVSERAPDQLDRVAPIVKTIEAAQFGYAPSPSSWWQQLYGDVERIARKTTPALLVVLLAALTSCHLSDRGDWDRSPSGLRGIVRFLNLAGIETHERLASLASLATEEDSPAQLVVLPDAELDEADWKHVERWLANEDDVRLVVVGSRPLPPWIRVSPAAGAPVASIRATPALTPPPAVAPTGHVPGRAQLRGADAHHETLLERGGTAYALRAPHPNAEIVVVADDNLFQNASLAVPGNAAVLAALLGGAGGPTDLVGALTGLVSPNPVASVGRARLAPFVLQLALVLALLFVARGAAFGRLVDPPRVERRAFVEHVEAVGAQYARARAARHAASLYATYVVERLRERVGAGSAQGVGELATAVAARTGRAVDDVARLIEHAHDEEARSESAAAASSTDSLGDLRELAALLEACSRRTPNRS